MKKTVCFMLCIIMVCSLVACGASSIIGKWEFGATTFNFKEDGTFSALCNGIGKSGTYAIENGVLSLNYSNILGFDTTTELKYTVDGDTLTLVGDVTLLGTSDITIEFTRAK